MCTDKKIATLPFSIDSRLMHKVMLALHARSSCCNDTSAKCVFGIAWCWGAMG